MKRRYTTERVGTTKKGLVAYVRVDAGTAVRWTQVLLPWGMVADHHRAIVESLERIYVAQLEADAEVQYLPLESWE